MTGVGSVTLAGQKIVVINRPGLLCLSLHGTVEDEWASLKKDPFGWHTDRQRNRKVKVMFGCLYECVFVCVCVCIYLCVCVIVGVFDVDVCARVVVCEPQPVYASVCKCVCVCVCE